MPPALPRSDQAVPRVPVLVSLGVLLVPVLGALAFSEALGESAALLWLLGLVPAFVLAYHRGWRGASIALAAGILTLAVTVVVAIGLALEVPGILGGVVAAYVAIALAVGFVTERLRHEREQVVDLAFTDTLTGLPNRRHALAFLDGEFEAARRGRHLAVVIFDLDHFKKYNDRYGHKAGDDVLVTFAKALARTTRRMNLSARYGGEEFVAVLAGSDADGAAVFAERVRELIAAHRLGDEALTTSAGVAEYHSSMRTPDELIAAADHALYEAKRTGRDRVRIFGRGPEGPRAAPKRSSAASPGRRSEPASEAPLAPQVEAIERTPGITGFGSGRSVLVVESDDQVREIVCEYLRKEGFEVTESEDALEGLSQLRTERDLVVTDIKLTGVTGGELGTVVKSRWPSTQVIMITGLQEVRTHGHVFPVGADRYLFKPFGMPELKAHLVDALRARDELLFERRQEIPRTFEERQRSDRVRDAVVDGARVLARAVEVRDPFTRGQSERVGLFALELADEIDPDGALIERSSLRLACELRDLGKIGVPDSILNKQDRLTPDERAKVRLHPQIGRKILEPLLDDEVVLGVVSWHHERWDGTGYPDGLAGETIPVSARVAALADALDAITSDRAWRRARPWADAVTEVRRRASRQFDPDLVAAFERALPRLREIYETRRETPLEARVE